MSGITSTGFVKKTLAEIKSELEGAYRSAFGNSLNVQPPSLAATQIGISAEREAKIWDIAEATWNSRAPSTSEGVGLDNVGDITANPRLRALASEVARQYFFGDAGTLVDTTKIFSVVGNPEAKFNLDTPVLLEAGTSAVQRLAFSDVPTSGSFTVTLSGLTTAPIPFGADAAAVQAAIRLLAGFEDTNVTGSFAAGFSVAYAGLAGKQPRDLIAATSALLATSTPIVITASETTPGVAQGVGKLVATVVGPTVALAGTLTTIVTPVSGLTRTVNATDALVGRLVETDVAYRLRRADELAVSGASTVEAIRTRVKKVLGVLETIVFENTTLATDGAGRPPKSVQVYVDGGTEADVGLGVWKAVAGGIETFGEVTVPVLDSQGLTQTVKFSRPIVKRTYVILDILTDPAVFPLDGVARVKLAVASYGSSLKIGERALTYPKLLPAIVDTVDGIVDISIRLGFVNPPTLDDNLAAVSNERISFDTADITVNVT